MLKTDAIRACTSTSIALPRNVEIMGLELRKSAEPFDEEPVRVLS